MNPEEILAKMKALTEEIKSKEGQLSEDDLGDFLNSVSESLGEVFSIAQSEINKGMQQIEAAQNQLKEQNMHDEAETISPLIKNMRSVQNQLDIGLEVAQQKRDFEGSNKDPQPSRLLTDDIGHNLRGLQSALEQKLA